MLEKLFTRRSVRLVTILASSLYFGYFWYENAINRAIDTDYAAITLWQFIQSLFS
jgi:hypothetical protein